MSLQRGNASRNRAPKHQNTTAFKHNKASIKTVKILSLPNEGLCSRCFEIVEWKKKYRKYKPLTQAATCTDCKQKTVKHAYHVVCAACASRRACCAKCLEQGKEIRKDSTASAKEELAQEAQVDLLLSSLKLRARRKILRRIERGEIDASNPEELAAAVDGAAAAAGDDDDDDDFDDDDEFDDDDDLEEDDHPFDDPYGLEDAEALAKKGTQKEQQRQQQLQQESANGKEEKIVPTRSPKCSVGEASQAQSRRPTADCKDGGELHRLQQEDEEGSNPAVVTVAVVAVVAAAAAAEEEEEQDDEGDEGDDAGEDDSASEGDEFDEND